MNIHEHFKTLISSGQLSHAYYLEGDDGSFAKEVTRMMYCINNKEKNCSCSNCRRILSNNHPDVTTVEADGLNIKVDQIREIVKTGALTSFSGEGQVFIIKDADKMNIQAANALLKFLEEPKENVTFFLVGMNKDALLPTIQSRVQSYKVAITPTLEKEAREKGYQFKALPIFERMGCTMDQVDKFANVADSWLDLINATMNAPYHEAILLAGKWDETFSDKEQKNLALKMVQVFVKDLYNRKKGLALLFHDVPAYSYEELVRWGSACDDFTRSIFSNGQYVLQLKHFLMKVKA